MHKKCHGSVFKVDNLTTKHTYSLLDEWYEKEERVTTLLCLQPKYNVIDNGMMLTKIS
jgi:hypothetical protein